MSPARNERRGNRPCFGVRIKLKSTRHDGKMSRLCRRKALIYLYLWRFAFLRQKNERAAARSKLLGSKALLSSGQKTADIADSADLLHFFLRDGRGILNAGKPQPEFVGICRTAKCFIEGNKPGLEQIKQ